VPFGLLMNELVTNAIKHAFPDRTGHIVLSVQRVEGQIELTVADNGVGMKAKESAKAPEKRGSDYVAIFVRQLGGTIVPAVAEKSGTTIRVRLPFLLAPPDDIAPLAA
jgi:two-component sensor histidine kinase